MRQNSSLCLVRHTSRYLLWLQVAVTLENNEAVEVHCEFEKRKTVQIFSRNNDNDSGDKNVLIINATFSLNNIISFFIYLSNRGLFPCLHSLI